MTVRALLLNGLPISLYESISVSQDYEQESSVDFRRTAAGTLKRRALWTGKIQTQINGRGVVPSGLSTFDFSIPYTLSCVAHRSVSSISHMITLPAARRSDVGSEPYALVFTGERWAATTFDSIAGDVYTVTTVAGAESYKVYYFPELTVMSDPPAETKADGTTPFGWTLTAREV